MNELEVLRQELKLVSDHAPLGSHEIVAKKVKISTVYLRMIRRGANMTVDSEENRTTIKKIIKAYRKEISKYQKILNKIEVKQ